MPQLLRLTLRSTLAPLVENSATANLGDAGTANHSHGVRVGAKVGASVVHTLHIMGQFSVMSLSKTTFPQFANPA